MILAFEILQRDNDSGTESKSLSYKFANLERLTRSHAQRVTGQCILEKYLACIRSVL